MTRPTLRIARAKPAARIPFATLRKALRLFSGKGVTREQRRANAIRWLRAMAILGDRHVLIAKNPPKWGLPGEPGVRQVFASRRLGERA